MPCQRIVPGMKFLCQIVTVQSFVLIVSLPNQLLGHIPITHISAQLTSLIENEEMHSDESDSEDEEANGRAIPDLTELFRPGQYVRAVVTAVKPPGTTEARVNYFSRNELEKTSRRVELSLIPELVNEGLVKADLKHGLVRSNALLVVMVHLPCTFLDSNSSDQEC